MSPTHIEPHSSADCLATREILNRVADKWSLYIISYLRNGPLRFNKLKSEVAGISQRMLTLALRGLERDGLVTRRVYPTNPPRVEYELTPLGRTLFQPVMALVAWAEEHRAEIQRAQETFDRRGSDGGKLSGPRDDL